MTITIITLFPEMFSGPFTTSIIKRAADENRVTIRFVNIRDFAADSYRTVDDHPYGGGTGMVLRVDVVDRAIRHALESEGADRNTTRVILLDPQGTPFVQKKAHSLGTFSHLVLVCGHYEGVDERIRTLVDEEISIGDYVLTGGEIPAMVIVDSVVRLLPGTLKKEDATINESFEDNLLEYPQYTRPASYNGQDVPEVLVQGDHAKINAWKQEQALKRTKTRRPDILKPKTSDR